MFEAASSRKRVDPDENIWEIVEGECFNIQPDPKAIRTKTKGGGSPAKIIIDKENKNSKKNNGGQVVGSVEDCEKKIIFKLLIPFTGTLKTGKYKCDLNLIFQFISGINLPAYPHVL